MLISLLSFLWIKRIDPEIIRPNHDLTSQLTSRKDRLSWLIRFINDNAALGKMSQRSRQRLATDAEKLYACHQLWLTMNEHLECVLSRPFTLPISSSFFISRTALGPPTPSSPMLSMHSQQPTPLHILPLRTMSSETSLGIELQRLGGLFRSWSNGLRMLEKGP